MEAKHQILHLKGILIFLILVLLDQIILKEQLIMYINKCQDLVDLEQIEIKIFKITDYSTILNIEAGQMLTHQFKLREIQILEPLEVEEERIQIQVVNQISKETYSQIHTTMDKATLQNSNITSNKITQC